MDTAEVTWLLKWSVVKTQAIASTSSSGSVIVTGMPSSVIADPSANFGLNMALNTGDARLRTLEETLMDVSSGPIFNNMSPAGSASS